MTRATACWPGPGRYWPAARASTLAGLLARTRTIVHGTTTGDNTMIQMSGAPTGFIVTRGFRDEIEFRRCYKEDIWDPALPAPRRSPAAGYASRSTSG